MHTRPGFQILARCGYAARGVVFILLAGLALATGATDTKSAIDSLLTTPLGQLWVGLIGSGLVGFVVWRLAQSLGNADHHKGDLKGCAARMMLLGSACVYASLAFYSFDHAIGLGAASNSRAENDLAAWSMAQPFGMHLVGLIGAGFIIGGVVTITKGVLATFERYLHSYIRGRGLIRAICLYGLAARGILFVIIGMFFPYAVFTVNPDNAGSMPQALDWIRHLPFGAVLYTVAAVGLVAFGGYNFTEARYRVVGLPDLAEAQ